MEKLFVNGKIRRLLTLLFGIVPLLLMSIGYLIAISNNLKANEYLSFFALPAGICLIFHCVVNLLFLAKIIRKNSFSLGLHLINIIICIGYCFADYYLSYYIDRNNVTNIIFAALSMLVNIAGIVFYILSKKYIYLEEDNEKEPQRKILSENDIRSKKTFPLFIVDCLALAVFTSFFFIKFFSSERYNLLFLAIDCILHPTTVNFDTFIYGMVLFVFWIFALTIFINCITAFISKEQNIFKYSKQLVAYTFIVSIILYLGSTIVAFVLGYYLKDPTVELGAGSLVLIAAGVVLVLHSFFNSTLTIEEKSKKEYKNQLQAKWLILIFASLFTLVTGLSLFVDFISLTPTGGLTGSTVRLTAYDLILNPSKNQPVFQVVGYIFFVGGLISLVLYVLILAAFFTKNKAIKRLGSASIIFNAFFVLIVGLFSCYFGIAKEIVLQSIFNTIKQYYPNFNVTTADANIQVNSMCFYLIFVDILLACFVFAFKPFSRTDSEFAPINSISLNNDNPIKIEFADKDMSNLGNQKDEINKEDNTQDVKEDEKLETFDACPAFTEIDALSDEFKAQNDKRLLSIMTNISLPDLTAYIVDYARESRLHLSYTHEDIATFIAGLGATKLSILQGMSGTGKTSLPKIFLEAIMGNCEIVEVESSWKDKNELLGYYNEFSKTFTPKKFTRALYKAAHNPDVITFIVLDEMNLSRIEYYFSDFLSLMENEPHNRKIQLVNVKLTNIYNNVRHSYMKLEKDHTLHIPENIWFIGTANRDESTFEISDKVYDRAHTMNFNKRAPKVRNFTKEMNQKYLPYRSFENLIKNAIKTSTFDLETVPYLKDLEEILRPYNISFGNRILNQIESFVKIYSSCFVNQEGVIDEALEKILLSKVVAKLEFKAVEDKQDLVRKLEKINLYKCAEFVKGLNEDL